MSNKSTRNVDLNLESIPSDKSIYIQNKSLDTHHRLCHFHQNTHANTYSKSQIKSMGTLPSRKDIVLSKASILVKEDRLNKDYANVGQSNTLNSVNRFMKPLVSKIAIKSKRHGQIYTHPNPPSSAYRSNKHITTEKSHINDNITDLEDENIRLRSKIVDYQLQ